MSVDEEDAERMQSEVRTLRKSVSQAEDDDSASSQLREEIAILKQGQQQVRLEEVRCAASPHFN